MIDLFETHRSINKKNLLETYHDAQQALDSALNLFSLGYLSLEQRSLAENFYWSICRKILKFAGELEFFPEELEGLAGMLSDTYFCNFSIFQSMPDSWAVKQLFPIMPIHRLNEPPTRDAVLGDISCDSDGKVDQFIDRRDVKKTLPLHPFNNGSYILGAFLLGAYQEILGDLHNLLGDTNAVHVSLDEHGDVVLETVIQGDTVREVLDYVQYNSQTLLDQFRKDVETAVREQRIGYEESGRSIEVLRRRSARLHVPGAVTVTAGDPLRVVLVSPRNPLNIGAVARAMSNFGFTDLRLVNPYDLRLQRSALRSSRALHPRSSSGFRQHRACHRGLHSRGRDDGGGAPRFTHSAASPGSGAASSCARNFNLLRSRCCSDPRNSDCRMKI